MCHFVVKVWACGHQEEIESVICSRTRELNHIRVQEIKDDADDCPECRPKPKTTASDSTSEVRRDSETGGGPTDGSSGRDSPIGVVPPAT